MTTAVTNTQNSQAAEIYSALNVTRETGTATEDIQNRFLTLLTAQLKNQDPTSPMDSAQMTSQLAQISTVDGIERLNDTLQKMLGSTTDAQAMQAAALVGRGVLVPGSALQLVEGSAVGALELSGPADQVTVAIKDASGLVQRTINLGALSAGVHGFSWDGMNDGGAPVVDGSYSMSIAAEQGGKSVTANALALGMVSSITRAGQGMAVNVGSLGAFTLADIREIL
ncbi:MAG: flagellar hook assembly protein FlgD [Gammaproteobacteria bacterium]|nr:flagellar hook assembly protein FlgD [Rhodocyclaceae bacterium]MBU3909522.1 flagellar hook assembly protein FlgD [Gammaproteobacteria bacterium]MBU3990095.1 flagellar hook assembly protein FlgD [Gammaproteobacteria bacterium]MBU4003185.1 flagellar hook assembly protein FlgD [Gammaproteobacteria bacterium]MBU4022234.1 flagellar hook assembly protein FlgD [Gammaproteobacteria bacterium]